MPNIDFLIQRLRMFCSWCWSLSKPHHQFELVVHAPSAPGMRWLGIGAGLRPTRSLFKLKRLLDHHTFWATDRSLQGLRTMLRHSNAVVSLWHGKRLVGFGRATSDFTYRAVLWDVVIPEDLQGQGLGRQLIEALLSTPGLRDVERVYLMTSKSSGFYEQLGFSKEEFQQLMRRSTASK